MALLERYIDISPAIFRNRKKAYRSMTGDVRTHPNLRHRDITRLNFINASTPYVFRKHFRQGLRSQIMEILDPGDVALEATGILKDGVRQFPTAAPRWMLRIFRSKFDTTREALDEIRRLKVVETYLSAQQYARSSEFLVDYQCGNDFHRLLCGLQEFVAGEVLNPWQISCQQDVENIFGGLTQSRLVSQCLPCNTWLECVRDHTRRFIRNIQHMVVESGYIPDLAGVGNLMLTADGLIKLVDINNISRIDFGTEVPLDDKGYPVGDKSIEALARLERCLLERPVKGGDFLYDHFLTPGRQRRVKALEAAFYASAVTKRGHS